MTIALDALLASAPALCFAYGVTLAPLSAVAPGGALRAGENELQLGAGDDAARGAVNGVRVDAEAGNVDEEVEDTGASARAADSNW